MIRYRSVSRDWKTVRLGMANKSGRSGYYGASLCRAAKLQRLSSTTSAGRITGGFEYVGPAMDRTAAREFADARPARFGADRLWQSIEALITRYPGATVGLLTRLSGLSNSMVRQRLGELIDAGAVRRAGRGGLPDPFAFYPIETVEAS